MKLIKLAIEELGNVNFGAIEEYERVSERYEFLLIKRMIFKKLKIPYSKSLMKWMMK